MDAEEALDLVVKDYADCPRLRNALIGKMTLGQEAEQNLFELKHLRIGQPASDIEAEDLDGVSFKLTISREN